jgi:transposase
MDEPECPGCLALSKRVAELEALVRELARKLEEATRAGKRQAAPFRKGPAKPDPKTPGRKSGEQHGQHGHRSPPTPGQINEIHQVHLPEACPHCQGELVEAEVAQQFQTEIPRQPIHRQFDVHIGHCRKCGRRVQGRHPLQTSNALGAAASQVGPDAQAAVVELNKQAGLSHGKVAGVMETLFGIDLTRGASAQIMLRAAERLEPAYEEIRTATANAERLSVDETGWRIGGQSAWLHVWVSEQATCYQVDQKRSADALEKLIGIDYDGTLLHDGYSTYGRFTEAAHQQCVPHLLRRAREMLETARGGAVHFPRRVIEVFSGAIHLRNEYLAGRVTPVEWESARDDVEERLLPLLHDGRVGANQTLSNPIANHFEEWFLFLTDSSVPASNYEAEQAIRPVVVNRKVWGGNRTDTGAKAQGILSSIWQTCKKQAKAAVDFVSETLRASRNPAISTPVLLEIR